MSSDDAPTLTDKQVYAKGLTRMVMDQYSLEDQLWESDYQSLCKTLERLFMTAYEQGEQNTRSGKVGE